MSGLAIRGQVASHRGVSADLFTQVAQALRLIRQKTRKLAVCVSGGSDSMVLLEVLLQLRQHYPLDLVVVHFNFGLRAKDSDGDEKMLRKYCRRHRLALAVCSFDKGPKASVQSWARSQRLDFFNKHFLEYELCEAHHADDQLETIVFRFLRGSGLVGLSAMSGFSYRAGRALWRPLLDVSKSQIREFAEAHSVPFREDHTNLKAIYTRNWIRLKLVPFLKTKFPSLQETLRRSQKLWAAENEFLEQSLLELKQRHGWQGQDDKWIEFPELSKIHRALRLRALTKWWCAVFRAQPKLKKLIELTELIESGVDFYWNGPEHSTVIFKNDKLEFHPPKADLPQKLASISDI